MDNDNDDDCHVTAITTGCGDHDGNERGFIFFFLFHVIIISCIPGNNDDCHITTLDNGANCPF